MKNMELISGISRSLGCCVWHTEAMALWSKVGEGGLQLKGYQSTWKRLPRGAVDGPFLAVFRARLEGALSNLV